MNTTIAKLLAKEDVTVQTGAYSTAWFDIKNRTLGLPDWKDMGKDVKDLLIGHEVGHALYTPFEGWHDSPEKLEGCPRSYINVVEDCRIEKKIKRDYPGLIGPMSRGYKKLVADQFFGDVDAIDWDKVKLIDKINLEAKIGNLIDVPMSDVEKGFYDKAMKTEEFSEVLDVVREILAWTKENQEELIQQPEATEDDSEQEENHDYDPSSQGHDDYDSEENQEEQNKDGGSDAGDEETEEESEDETSLKSAIPQHDEDISVTDSIFRAMEKTLIPESTEFTYGNAVSKDIIKKCVFKYEELAKQRIKMKERENALDYNNEIYKNSIGPFYQSDSEEKFKSYIKGVKKAIVPAVKEFEQKKAAHQWMHATTAKTGRIDVNKLHRYKVSEDIFAKTTQLANSKNHGMFMIIDYSGSMFDSLNNVLDQLIHSVMFCKAVNIPFDVYAFTSGNNVDQVYKDGDIYMDSLSMPQLIHSGLTKSKFEDALKHLFSRMKQCNGPYDRWSRAECEDFGSTPLNQALIVAHDLVRDFKKKFGIEKVTFLTITDGDTNRLNIMEDRTINKIRQESYYNPKVKLDIQGRTVELFNGTAKGTRDLLQNLKKSYGVTTMGFFIADHRNDFNHALSKAHYNGEENMWWSEEMSEAKKGYFNEHKKNKCVHFQDVLGYDNWYVVKNESFQIDADAEIEADTDMSKGQVLRAFKKFSNNKKNNKNLMTKFGQAVA